MWKKASPISRIAWNAIPPVRSTKAVRVEIDVR
jgi:hypothetical protein